MSITFYGIDTAGRVMQGPNMGNRNAADFLRFLGLHEYGLWDGNQVALSDFINACSRAKNRVTDEGLATRQYSAAGGATVVECGRAPGWLPDMADLFLEGFLHNCRAFDCRFIYWG